MDTWSSCVPNLNCHVSYKSKQQRYVCLLIYPSGVMIQRFAWSIIHHCNKEVTSCRFDKTIKILILTK